MNLALTSWHYFWISTGSANATEKMVLKKTTKTWIGAREYCRDHYTDLAIIGSKEDNDQITQLIYNLGVFVWIGLYRDSWKWSDQANITSSTQLATQSFTWWNEDCAGLNIYYRKMDDRLCTTAYYFYCNTGRSDLNYCVHIFICWQKLNMTTWLWLSSFTNYGS